MVIKNLKIKQTTPTPTLSTTFMYNHMSYLLIQWIQGLCSFQRPVLLLVFWITCSFSILKDFALAIILSLTYISNFLLSNGLFSHTTICHNTLCKRKKNYLDPICLFILIRSSFSAPLLIKTS